jgi:hypothetical protein
MAILRLISSFRDVKAGEQPASCANITENYVRSHCVLLAGTVISSTALAMQYGGVL